MVPIPIVSLQLIRQRLNQTGTNEPFVLHQFHAQNAPISGECRMEVYFIALLHQGELQVETDLEAHTVTAPALFAMGPSTIRNFVHNSLDFRSEVIFFDQAYFLQPLADQTALEKHPFFLRNESHLIPIDQGQHQEFSVYFQLIQKQINQPTPFSSPIVRNLLQALLFEISTLYTSQKSAAGYSFQQVVYSIFRQNLENHYRAERKVRFYAGLQHLSAKHFSAVIQQQTGQTAGQLIDQRIVLEARALLQNKALSIRQIADQLGFEDAANFGKYFKNLVGLSPSQFRNALNG